MKTMIRSINVQNDHGIVSVGIRMPNGDLKRKHLMKMLKDGAVLPQVAVNRILLEVLNELDGLYSSRRGWVEKALELRGAIDVVEEKCNGDIETCVAEKNELLGEVDDLHADMADMYFDKLVSETTGVAGAG